MDEAKARRLFERGRARWPELAVSFDAFARELRPHLATLADLGEDQICAEDLYLVAVCLQRVPGAVDRFDAYIWPDLERHLRGKKLQPHELVEMRQTLLVRLFVPAAEGEPPRIAEYTGRGRLLFWVRMAAVRLALNARRDEGRLTSLGDSYLQRAASASSDIELSFIRGRYEADFVEALRAAVTRLSDEQRMLLQFRYREELTSDQIAVVLKTSRVTAHRRVVAAREALAGQVRDGLRARLALSDSGLQTLMTLLSSRLVPALAAELRQGLAR